MTRPQLYGTPLSHFTRKLRVLFAELAFDHEMVWAPTVLATAASTFGNNPMLRVPTLVHDGETVLESDHIARVIVRAHDPADRLDVCSERVHDLNRLAVANGIMDNEVVLLLARRSGLTDVDGVAYFRKLMLGIDGGFAWLDARVDPDDPRFTYTDIAMVCAWQHVLHFDLVREPARFTRVAARVARFAERPSVRETTPTRSLAVAAEAGWTPG